MIPPTMPGRRSLDRLQLATFRDPAATLYLVKQCATHAFVILVAEINRGSAKYSFIALDGFNAFDQRVHRQVGAGTDRKSTRLNSSH